MSQNYPNPFNSTTRVSFSVAKPSHIKIVLFDILGREASTLIEGMFIGGDYTVQLEAEKLSSGVYYYSMFTDAILFDTKKMVLVK